MARRGTVGDSSTIKMSIGYFGTDTHPVAEFLGKIVICLIGKVTVWLSNMHIMRDDYSFLGLYLCDKTAN